METNGTIQWISVALHHKLNVSFNCAKHHGCGLDWSIDSSSDMFNWAMYLSSAVGNVTTGWDYTNQSMVETIFFSN